MVYLAHKTALMSAILLLLNAMMITGCSSTHAEQPPSNPELLPYYNTPDFTPHFYVSDSEAQTKIAHTIGNFALTDQDGKLVTNDFVAGKIHVADFFFSSCGSICPKMTNNMKNVHEAFANDPDVVLLSFSVAPWQDSVPVLKQFVTDREIDSPNWRFLTGPKSEIYDLARRSYFAEQEIGYTKDSTEFLHTEHFVLVDDSGRIRGIYDGTMPLDVEQLIADIHSLEGEQNDVAWK